MELKRLHELGDLGPVCIIPARLTALELTVGREPCGVDTCNSVKVLWVKVEHRLSHGGLLGLLDLFLSM